MKFIISGKNITVTDGLRTAVEDKLGKLERYFTPDTEVVVMTMGLPKAAEMLKEGVAMGADKGVLLTDRVLGGSDTCASLDIVTFPLNIEVVFNGFTLVTTRSNTFISHVYTRILDILYFPLDKVTSNCFNSFLERIYVKCLFPFGYTECFFDNVFFIPFMDIEIFLSV